MHLLIVEWNVSFSACVGAGTSGLGAGAFSVDF